MTPMTQAELHEAMEQLGLDDKALANELGSSLGAVRKWRSGERPISNPVAILIRMRVRGRTRTLNEVMKAHDL
jgi:DNA-binding transcriptional regulator YiaG